MSIKIVPALGIAISVTEVDIQLLIGCFVIIIDA